MPVHEVREAECLDSIAFLYGLFPESVWTHPENQPLRAVRETGYQLVPGDLLFIPEIRLRQHECVTGQRHRFRRRGVPAKLRLRLLDIEGQPRQDAAYVLQIDPGLEFEGVTTPDGVLEQFIPPDAVSGRVAVEAPEFEPDEVEIIELSLSQLRPDSLVLGVQQRLHNLGFLAPPLSGVLDETTGNALRCFQRFRNLGESGAIDSDTLSALRRDFHSR